VEKLLNQLLLSEFTKSRANRSADNALVEGKNGAVVRKHIARLTKSCVRSTTGIFLRPQVLELFVIAADFVADVLEHSQQRPGRNSQLIRRAIWRHGRGLLLVTL
jgi:hypothetical protein